LIYINIYLSLLAVSEPILIRLLQTPIIADPPMQIYDLGFHLRLHLNYPNPFKRVLKLKRAEEIVGGGTARLNSAFSVKKRVSHRLSLIT